MNILGINYDNSIDSSDPSAALLTNNGIQTIEEERLNKIKHSPIIFPKLSVLKLLELAKLRFEDIDIIVVSNAYYSKNIKEQLIKQFDLKDGQLNCNIIPCEHHLAHILNSYYQCYIDNAVGIAIDCSGDDFKSISIYDICNNSITLKKSFNIFQSIGLLYLLAAKYCNFGISGEGKLMGLAPFGKAIKNNFFVWSDNTITIQNKTVLNIFNKFLYSSTSIQNNTIINEKIISKYIQYIFKYFKSLYPFKQPNESNEIIYYSNFAATIQQIYTDIFINIAKFAKSCTKQKNLILGGGCIQNCTANNILIQQNIFDKVFCSNTPYDGGLALGYVYYAARIYNIFIKRKPIQFSPIIYTINDIDTKYLDKIKICSINKDKIADDIINNKIIGWFYQNSELGPRALGHRSLIANASNRENLFKLNTLKQRDMFRPLGPIILDTKFNSVFNTQNNDLTQYMLRTLVIDDKYINQLQAVCHIDNTTRPQLLHEVDNSFLYDIIKIIYNKTNIPGIINTSFNKKNKPIVETINDAIEILLSEKLLDYIVFNNNIKIQRI